MRSNLVLSSVVPLSKRNSELQHSTHKRLTAGVHFAAAAVLCLGLAGCGGSDPVSQPIQTPQSTPPPLVTPPPSPPPAAASAGARFAYATNAADGTISIYAADSQSGQLRANGYVEAGVNARAIAVDPTNTLGVDPHAIQQRPAMTPPPRPRDR